MKEYHKLFGTHDNAQQRHHRCTHLNLLSSWGIEYCTKKTIFFQPTLGWLSVENRSCYLGVKDEWDKKELQGYCFYVCCTIQRVVIKQIAEALQRTITKGIIMF